MLLPRLPIALAFMVSLGAGSAFAHGPGGHGEIFSAGMPGDPKKPSRLVTVTMSEDGEYTMVYSPDSIEVKQGEQIHFVLKNNGVYKHEFMLASVKENAAHKALMEKHPEMEHDDPNAKTVKAKGSDDMIWQFTKAGVFEYACLVPGHYESGMHGVVTVRPPRSASSR